MTSMSNRDDSGLNAGLISTCDKGETSIWNLSLLHILSVVASVTTVSTWPM